MQFKQCLRVVAISMITLVGAPSAIAGMPDADDVFEVVVPDSPVRVRTWSVEPKGGNIEHWNEISLDGQAWSRPRLVEHELTLRHASFDPLLGVPEAPQVGEADDDGRGLYIVQFISQPLEAYRDVLEAGGGIVRRFVPHNAWIVELDADTVAGVQAEAFVRWVGVFEPAYRLELVLLDALLSGDDRLVRVNIMVFSPEQKPVLVGRLARMGAQIDMPDAGKFLVEASLSVQDLGQVAGWNEVLFIDRWSPYTTDMDIAREIGGANYVEAMAGYTGNGVRGEVIDVGFNISHLDFQAQPLILHTAVNSDSHGAATSGIIFGDGSANPMGRGMIPDAQGIVADWDVVSVGQARYNHTGELTQPPYEAVFQSASVGSLQVTNYTTISADTDAALFDFDILHCQSQSNTGSQASRPQAWAKNIVSVGGIRHMNTLDTTDDCWGCRDTAASIGPGQEGRIKPDLSHFYDNIFTVTSGGNDAYTTSFGGTSGATPIVAGHFGVFYEMWNDGIFGNIVDPNGTVFSNRPHMSTAKAMLINSARQYDFSGTNHDLTRVHQGWGMPSLQDMYDRRDSMMIIDETDLVSNLDSMLYAVTVQPGETALKATLVYSDPPGNPAVTVARVNDLSLRVTSPDGTMYWGNNGLMAGPWSTEGGDSNTVDTVENVFVADPTPGQWTIEVLADEIVEDGHVETPQMDADYALVVSGVEPIVPALAIQLPAGIPELVPPGQMIEIPVTVLDGGETVVPESVTSYFRVDPNDDFATFPAAHLGGSDYLMAFPGPPCGVTPEFYVTAAGDGGTEVSSPALAPDAVYTTEVGVINVLVLDDFEVDTGWTVENDPNLTDGPWERGVPVGGGDRGDPAVDFDGSGQCFLTDNVDDNSDVDGGITWLISPTFDLSDGDAVMRFALWYSNNFGADPNNDFFNIDLSNDDGNSWVPALTIGPSGNGGWNIIEIAVGPIVAPTSQVRIRFEASDLNAGSVVEAGLDDFRIQRFECESPCVGDTDGNGAVDIADLLGLLSAWGTANPLYDIAPDGGDGTVDVMDLLTMLSVWGPCTP